MLKDSRLISMTFHPVSSKSFQISVLYTDILTFETEAVLNHEVAIKKRNILPFFNFRLKSLHS